MSFKSSKRFCEDFIPGTYSCGNKTVSLIFVYVDDDRNLCFR